MTRWDTGLPNDWRERMHRMSTADLARLAGASFRLMVKRAAGARSCRCGLLHDEQARCARCRARTYRMRVAHTLDAEAVDMVRQVGEEADGV